MYLKNKDKKLLLSVYVIPRSSKTEIIGVFNDALKIKLKSPPVDNEANKELINFLAQKLKISKLNIDIISGYKNKRKIFTLSECSLEVVKGILEKDNT